MKINNKEILVFGGSFDPPHKGHTALAEYALHNTGANEVWMMPSPQNPLKSAFTSASGEQRLEMCRLASLKCHGIKACGFELTLSEMRPSSPSYTIETLEAMAKNWPDYNFKLLVGADNWLCFDKWMKGSEIIDKFGLVVYPRPGVTLVDAVDIPGVEFLEEAPQTDISSTELRKWLRAGKSEVLEYLDPLVVKYIKAMRLYK